jgi:peptidoglycan-N-acetylglucosamine deacetylase
MIVKVPQVVKFLFPRRMWEGPKEGKKIYLTFDDGPIPQVTPWVLAQLKMYDARATFFCIGDNIRKHPQVFTQILSGGHAVGNHTFNHLNGWMTSKAEYLANTAKAQQVLEQNLPQHENPSEDKRGEKLLFRPPYGRMKGAQARDLAQQGYQIVMWDVLSRDYDSSMSPERCYLNVVNHAQRGSIIVFHDSLKAEKNLRVALPKLLQYYSSKGFSFEKLR